MKNQHSEGLKYLKIAQGNLEASMKMVDDDRYCVDISNQILATIALLKKANTSIITNHMDHCVMEAFNSDDEALKQEKMEEVEMLLKKVIN
jgi:DNA-binding FrmR family transcriptional regulator